MFSCVQLYSCLCLDAWEPRQLPSQSYKLKQLQKEQTFNKIWQERNSFFFWKKKKKDYCQQQKKCSNSQKKNNNNNNCKKLVTFSFSRSSSNICSISVRHPSCSVRNEFWSSCANEESEISSRSSKIPWKEGRLWGSCCQQSKRGKKHFSLYFFSCLEIVQFSWTSTYIYVPKVDTCHKCNLVLVAAMYKRCIFNLPKVNISSKNTLFPVLKSEVRLYCAWSLLKKNISFTFGSSPRLLPCKIIID